MENDARVVGPDALTANFQTNNLKTNKLDTATAHRNRPAPSLRVIHHSSAQSA
jgi:hypothetical protein